MGGTERDWRSSYAIAIGVTQNKVGEIHFPTSKFAKEIAKELGRTLAALAEPWSEFTGKAGELLEVSIDHKKIKRIFFVGVGSADLDAYRKAATTLARKVKGLEQVITHALEPDRKFATAHFTSLILASYSWNQKSKPNPKPATVVVIGDYESELTRARILGGAVWRMRARVVVERDGAFHVAAILELHLDADRVVYAKVARRSHRYVQKLLHCRELALEVARVLPVVHGALERVSLLTCNLARYDHLHLHVA